MTAALDPTGRCRSMHSANDNSPSDVSEFNDNWLRWKEMVRNMPDVRADKVEQARSAIRGRDYDDESVVDETVERIAVEIAAAMK